MKGLFVVITTDVLQTGWQVAECQCQGLGYQSRNHVFYLFPLTVDERVICCNNYGCILDRMAKAVRIK